MKRARFLTEKEALVADMVGLLCPCGRYKVDEPFRRCTECRARGFAANYQVPMHKAREMATATHCGCCGAACEQLKCSRGTMLCASCRWKLLRLRRGDYTVAHPTELPKLMEINRG